MYRVFSLTEAQIAKLEEWHEEHTCREGVLTYLFTPNGIGLGVGVSCSCGGTLTLTEWENW